MTVIDSIRSIEGVSVFDLSGKIVIGEGDTTLSNTLELLGNGRHKVLLNFENVSHLDASGIGALVACFERIRFSGGTLKLLKPSGKVRNLLQMVHLEHVFESFTDEEQALASFRA